MWSQMGSMLKPFCQTITQRATNCHRCKCVLNCKKDIRSLALHHNVSRDIFVRNASLWGSSNSNAWSKAVSEAEKIVGYPTSFMSLRCLLSDELSNVAMQMRKLVGTKHPLLKTARKFFYDGKHAMQTRGLLVLLMSKTAGPNPAAGSELEPMNSGIYQSQRSLAEIIEMINTANMIHKGMVNLNDLQPSDGSRQDMHFGNKMSVLSGDFLLANASTGLAELNNTYVVELISSAIQDLMEAEFVNLRDNKLNPILSEDTTIQDWEHHTYLSSGSLIAKSCKAALMLAGHGEAAQEKALHFGKHTAFAHQLNEDIAAFETKSDNGTSHTVISAPVILYATKYPNQAKDMGLFNNPDISYTALRKIITKSDALQEARALCRNHGELALGALDNFTDSEAKLALNNIVQAIIPQES